MEQQMTLRHSARSPLNRTRPHAFTLIELLVAVMVIAILISVLVVVVARANKTAIRARVKADLAAISTALEAYKQDFRDYPRVPVGDPLAGDGAQLLCWALVAPGPANVDGANGPGFRARRVLDAFGNNQGQVYGPYIDIDRFQIATVGTSYYIRDGAVKTLNPTNNVVPPILYFVARSSAGPAGKVSVEAVNGFVTNSDTSNAAFVNLYNSGQNSAFDSYWVTPTIAGRLLDMQRMMGARNAPYDHILAGEKAA
jgi:prepilin-type N-terminal cleavage/methylation domain-containing protein